MSNIVDIPYCSRCKALLFEFTSKETQKVEWSVTFNKDGYRNYGEQVVDDSTHDCNICPECETELDFIPIPFTLFSVLYESVGITGFIEIDLDVDYLMYAPPEEVEKEIKREMIKQHI